MAEKQAFQELLLFLEWIEICSRSKLEALSMDNYTTKLVSSVNVKH